jgi:glucosamine-6-phosphate deaminase
MEVIIVPDSVAMSRIVASAIASLVTRKPDAVVGIATGSTVLPVYDALAQQVLQGSLSFAQCRVFLLDEYVGLPPDHPQSYRSFARREIVGRLRLRPEFLLAPDASSADLPGACDDYEHAIRKAGGVDLQLLGIGSDGHIGFNEPCSSLASRTRVKTLTTQTRMDNARFFDTPDEVPHQVITQGIATILESRHVILMATGRSKASVVSQAIEGPLSSFIPASAMQLHAHATVVIDEAAASRLTLADYFREAFALKPAWQGL